MGLSHSTASTVVDNCINSAISVVNKATADASSGGVEKFEIDLKDCVVAGDLIIHDIDVNQDIYIDASAAAQMLADVTAEKLDPGGDRGRG